MPTWACPPSRRCCSIPSAATAANWNSEERVNVDYWRRFLENRKGLRFSLRIEAAFR
jgi:hypothetical protein